METQPEILFLSRKILELNQQLVESQSAKTHFVSLVANQLNNPMTTLLGLIKHLEPAQGEKKHEIFAMVHEAVLELDFRIQNLVATARIESGSCENSATLVDIKSLVDEALEALQYMLDAKEMLVVIDDAVAHRIVTDAAKLYRIILNLLANACQYGDTNSDIEIALKKANNTLEIIVHNVGDAPKVEFKPQIFTRFAASAEGAHGLGLGLSIVRSYCEMLDGSVDFFVSDRKVTFVVQLPITVQDTTISACGSDEFLFESFDDAIEL
ncbi:MAG: hypothetical protein KU37_11675 [Sulfuricurvum sp. PC08-66]|nr:MAG: hypothetical protein KU37_11675 [Sulfuricurvum sp. PC08-66]